MNNIPFSLYICLEQYLSHSRLYTIFSLDLPIESIPPTPLFFLPLPLLHQNHSFASAPSPTFPVLHCHLLIAFTHFHITRLKEKFLPRSRPFVLSAAPVVQGFVSSKDIRRDSSTLQRQCLLYPRCLHISCSVSGCLVRCAWAKG